MPPRRARAQRLPGGYKLGEKVFFTGTSDTFDDGDKVVHGQQGEVTGPATLEGYVGKGVAVLFPGNNSTIQQLNTVNCLLTEVRHPTQPLRAPTE